MPHLMPTPHLHSASRLTSDQLWAGATMALAAVGVVLAAFGGYDAAAILGTIAVLTGAWSMLVSANRAERFETVIATVAAAVTVAASLAYGSGFSFGGVM